MLIFLLIILLLCSAVVLVPIKNNKIKVLLYSLVGFSLMIAAAFRKGWADYDVYIEYFQHINKGYDVPVEISYGLISKFVYIVSDDVILLFIIYAFLGVTLKLIAISKLSKLWFLSLIFYISYYYIVQDLIQIRAAVATGFVLLSIKPLYDRKFLPFFLFFLCAFFFHYSAIVILPLWFLSKKKGKSIFLASLIPLSYVFFFLGLNFILNLVPIPAIQEKILLYKSLQELGEHNTINVFNIKFLLKVILFYIFLWKADTLVGYNKYIYLLIKIYGISLFVFPALAFLPILSYRMNEIYGIVEIILFPLLIYTANPRFLSKIIVILLGFSFYLMYLNLISY